LYVYFILNFEKGIEGLTHIQRKVMKVGKISEIFVSEKHNRFGDIWERKKIKHLVNPG
jgi:hypothetical protein